MRIWNCEATESVGRSSQLALSSWEINRSISFNSLDARAVRYFCYIQYKNALKHSYCAQLQNKTEIWSVKRDMQELCWVVPVWCRCGGFDWDICVFTVCGNAKRYSSWNMLRAFFKRMLESFEAKLQVSMKNLLSPMQVLCLYLGKLYFTRICQYRKTSSTRYLVSSWLRTPFGSETSRAHKFAK